MSTVFSRLISIHYKATPILWQKLVIYAAAVRCSAGRAAIPTLLLNGDII